MFFCSPLRFPSLIVGTSKSRTRLPVCMNTIGSCVRCMVKGLPLLGGPRLCLIGCAYLRLKVVLGSPEVEMIRAYTIIRREICWCVYMSMIYLQMGIVRILNGSMR